MPRKRDHLVEHNRYLYCLPSLLVKHFQTCSTASSFKYTADTFTELRYNYNISKRQTKRQKLLLEKHSLKIIQKIILAAAAGSFDSYF